MTLMGDFESFSLSSLFQLFGNDLKSGALHIKNPPAGACVFFKDGAVIHAYETGAETRLANFLKSKGRITNAQLDDCLLQTAPDKPLNQVLVENSFISAAGLHKLKTQLAEETVFRLFLWEKGEFEFRENQEPEESLLHLNVTALLLEASRKVDEMARLKERVGPPRAIFKIAETTPGQKEIRLSPPEWRVLSLVDGVRSVEEIIHESGFGQFAVYKIIYTLSGAGLLTASGMAAPKPGASDDPSPKHGHVATILVVDDMKQIRNILRYSLKKEGYNVLVADNGETALHYALGPCPPDLMVLDIMMPVLNGYAVIRRLRESETTKSLPVIFLTSKAQKTDVMKGIQMGGNDYVLKPYKFAELHRKIRRLLGQEDDVNLEGQV